MDKESKEGQMPHTEQIKKALSSAPKLADLQPNIRGRLEAYFKEKRKIVTTQFLNEASGVLAQEIIDKKREDILQSLKVEGRIDSQVIADAIYEEGEIQSSRSQAMTSWEMEKRIRSFMEEARKVDLEV